MEQDIFSGVGNIIKNETFFRVGIHPESLFGNIPIAKLKKLIFEARNYSNSKITRKNTGVKNQRSFFCEQCQKLY